MKIIRQAISLKIMLLLINLILLSCNNIGQSSIGQKGDESSQVTYAAQSDEIILREVIMILEENQYYPSGQNWIFQLMEPRSILKNVKSRNQSFENLQNVFYIELTKNGTTFWLEEWVFDLQWFNAAKKESLSYMYSLVGDGEILKDSEHMFNYGNRLINVRPKQVHNRETLMAKELIMRFFHAKLDASIPDK